MINCFQILADLKLSEKGETQLLYYAVQFNDEKIIKYVIWYNGEKDGIVCKNGKLLFFDSVKLLKEFCSDEKILLSNTDEPPVIYDLGYLKNWLRSPDNDFDCSEMLDFWNIIADALKNTESDFIGDCEDEDIDSLYDKLFYGCNLPSYNTSDEKYIPEWTNEEIELLQKVLSQYKTFWPFF